MAYDKKLKKAMDKANVPTEAKGTKEFFVPSTKYPHIHFYDDGCELRHGNSGGIKLVFASNQLNEGNLKQAEKEGGDIATAAGVIRKYY